MKRDAIQAVGIMSKPRKNEVAAVAPQLIAWLEKRGLRVLYDEETASCMENQKAALARTELAGKVDFLIVLGGDGTLLAAARALDGKAAPVLPVNLGGLGFLTSVTLDEFYPVLEEALAGTARISERIMLQAEVVREGRVIEKVLALNDAVLNKAALARILDIDLTVDGTYACTYKADGLIVATPTGSTAYSLSAGGPIVHPVLDAFVLTPICPHVLANRPLVIPDSLKLEIEWKAGEEPVYLTLDGQVGVALERGDRLVVTKAASKLRLVRPARKFYFELLRRKLKWGER